jgi:DNA-binding CsgD family transcriptional regulator
MMAERRGKTSGGPATGVLRGRRTESAVLAEVISAVRQGESRTLVVRGDAGVGKTALLDHALESATDLRVLRAAGVESEMELPFAVLHQLCAPMLDVLGRLPDPQREALSIVFGRSAGPRPDPFMVGLAVLSLTSEIAAERPLLCVVDDSQWLDKATAQTLTLVARRLRAEAVGLIFGARETGEEFRGVPHLEVQGLRNADARALLGSVVGFMLDERVRDRIVAETRGNPLALLELPRGLTATQLAGGFGLSGPHSLPGRIEMSFVRQADLLPPETRSLLLIAAAEPIGDPLLVWRAAERLGIEGSAAAAAEMEGLLTIGERVTFRHPLVRSAIYRSASLPERRAAHLALAEVTDREVDPDRRAWHLATAASGPDEDVALELERSARRAQARGGFAAEAAFLHRCVALTREPTRRADRALAAAQASLRTGAFDTALAVLTAAEAGPLDDLGKARVDLLRAEAAYSLNRGSDAPPLLLRAARALETLDPRLARETYLDAWSAALFAGELATSGNLLDVSRAARAAGAPTEPGRASDLLLDGLTLLFTEGRDAGVPVLEKAATAFASADIPVEEVLRWGWLGVVAAAMVWDFETCTAVAARQVEVARASGALAVLAVGVNVLGQVAAMAGDLEDAASLIVEAQAVKEATGTHIAPYGTLVHAALKGREDEAFPLIEATIRSATAEGQGTAVQYARWASSVVLNALGRYEEALTAAELASDDTPEFWVAAWALSERIEAAVRSGKIAHAALALERLTEQTRGVDSGWALGLAARARALLSQGETAESCYLEAIDGLSGSRVRPELARAHLLYGEWLRREGRRVDARTQLRTAHDMFTAIGMEAFAERTRRELLATGETVRKRNVETHDELTQQEKQIALLARDGLSNPEVGSRLFISPRTVEWHLRKVFAKLEISSRKELRSVLSGAEYEFGQAN